jgi:hypothetical protein
VTDSNRGNSEIKVKREEDGATGVPARRREALLATMNLSLNTNRERLGMSICA